MKKVRIVNDGKSSYDTKITDAETGEDLTGLYISEVSIQVRDKFPVAILTMHRPVIDIIADAEIKHVCPVCGRAYKEQEEEQV